MEIADIISRGLLVGTVMSAVPITKKETQFVILISLKKKYWILVKNEIQRQAELALKESDKDEILKVADRKKEVQRRCAEADQQIERLQKELAAVQKYKKKTYENYVDGVLDKEEYLSYKAEYEKQDKDIRAKIQLAEQEKDSFGEAEESYENWIEKFIKYGTLSEVTREIVTELIEKIVVNGDKSIDIVFKYQSPYPVEKQAV